MSYLPVAAAWKGVTERAADRAIEERRAAREAMLEQIDGKCSVYVDGKKGFFFWQLGTTQKKKKKN